MWYSTALTAAVLALASWIVHCLVAEPPRIEEALRAEAVQALEAAGLQEDVRPVFSGRDAALEGLVASPAQMAEAERAVAAVAGVRTVINRIRMRQPTGQPPPSFLEIRTRPGGVTLLGAVPNEARRLEILGRAREVFGADRVEERVTVDAAVEDGVALAGAADVVAALAEAGEGVKIRLRGDRLRISGTAANAETLRRIEDRVRGAVPERRLFFSTLRVRPDPGQGARDEGGS